MNECCEKWLTKDIMYEEIEHMYEEIEQSNIERKIKYVMVEVKYCPQCGERIKYGEEKQVCN